VLPERVRLPELLRRSLRFVPAAVLTAIYAPELFLQQGELQIGLHNEKLLAGLAALHLLAWLV
jgi:branched-subunit amino acid transport protein